MKLYFTMAILLISTNLVFAQNDSTKTHINDSVTYTCTMHPEIITNQSGKCPKCGMDLIKKSSSTYEKMSMMMCPMHGMVDTNHNHDGQKKKDMKMMRGMGLGMGIMMVIMVVILASN